VTATIANGKESGSYTQNFTITAYQADPVGPSENPFGDDTSPYIWAVDDNMGGIGYVTVKNTTWVATDGGSTYNSGTYTPASIAVVPWIVGTGYNTGDTGLAFISSGKMHVVNLSSVFSDMNGTLTKLDTNKTLDGGGTGTWTTSGPSIYYYNDWVKIVASSGSFTESVAPDGSAWREIVKGTYPNTTNTNPAICTITQVDIGFLTNGAPDWKNWSDLDPVQKQSFGGSETFPVIIYNDRCETYGITLQP
jgi:hypothetical protein